MKSKNKQTVVIDAKPETISIVHTFNSYDKEQIDDLINHCRNARLVHDWYTETFRKHYKYDAWKNEAKQKGIKLHDKTVDFIYEKLKEYFNGD
jgi:hypothetical protein